jgi:inosine-uridine nucleoside N-ribohydrolase
VPHRPLVGIGPATNLALALITEPAIATNVARIVLMSGAWAEGNVTPAAGAKCLERPNAAARWVALGGASFV